MLGWNFRAASLRQAWPQAERLRWLHWCGAGVDAALFPELINSQVQLTNARGIFDQPIAEWVLGVMLGFAKRLPQTYTAQMERRWHHQQSEQLAGKRALVVGTGAIGRAIGRQLQAVGLHVEGVGRSAREGGSDFACIHAVGDLLSLLPQADYVILITPLTPQTRELFGTAEFAAMSPHARFINVGRGALVVEDALLQALNDGSIAGAALDVFVEEPLPPESPFWQAPNCIVSPHMSGDILDSEEQLAAQFMANWQRYRAGEALHNRVDKALGFVPN